MYSKRIKELRTALDLSRLKLSKKIDIPERTIASYEDGRIPSLEFLAQLCEVLNVNPAWFLFGKGNMFNCENVLSHDTEFTQKVEKIVQDMKKRGII